MVKWWFQISGGVDLAHLSRYMWRTCPAHTSFSFFQFVQVDCWRGSKSSLRDVIFWYSLIAKSLPVDCKISQGTLHWGLLLLATPCSIFDGCCTHEKLQLSSYNQLHRCTQMWPFAQGICMVTGAAVITFAFVLSHFFASRSEIYMRRDTPL